jgi:hypothetical protein
MTHPSQSGNNPAYVIKPECTHRVEPITDGLDVVESCAKWWEVKKASETPAARKTSINTPARIETPKLRLFVSARHVTGSTQSDGVFL